MTRYRDAVTPDYSHRYHAGNVGDVWKHCALVEILRRTAAASRSVAYLESHAGEGRYALGPTGEWTEGIGRLWAAPGAATDDAVGRYVALCRRPGRGAARPETYPGSPAFARAVLGPNAELGLWERDAVAYRRLAAELRGDSHARVHHGDGLSALAAELRAAEERAVGVVALVDPSWTAKTDWSAVPDAVIAAAHASTRACIVLWYPLKSLTRPNAMLARFDRAGIGATVIELVTTPLGERRPRLNGSGVLLVRPPADALAALAAALPVIGAQCATRGSWSARIVADARRSMAP